MVIKKRKIAAAFTLIELMVVILILGILAAASVPLMRSRSEKAKWSEADASCGTIWTAVRTFIAEKGPNHDYSDIEGTISTASVRGRLGFGPDDLTGTYFDQGSYKISDVDGSDDTGPSCKITVTSPAGKGPVSGPGTFTAKAGAVDWAVTGL